MKTRIEETEVEIEITVKVKFSVCTAERGSRDSMSVPEEPDYIGNIELVYPEYDDLDDKIKEYIDNECWKSLEE